MKVPFDGQEFRNMSLEQFVDCLELGARPAVTEEMLPADYNWLRELVSPYRPLCLTTDWLTADPCVYSWTGAGPSSRVGAAPRRRCTRR